MNDPFASASAASRVRHGVLAVTTLMAVLLYLDRVCISVAAPEISKAFDLDKGQMGWVMGVFFLAYALAQVPAGWLGDRLGARLMLTTAVLAWSLMTALTSVVTGLATLIAVRLLFGIGQAGAYPITAKIYSQWIPFPRRGFASSVVTLGGRAGGALAPWVTAMLITTLGDWRPVFWIYGLLGLLWSAFFWSWFRNTPAEHAACNAAERRVIEGNRPAAASSPHGQVHSIPWQAIVRSRSLWLQCAAQFTGNIAWTFLITWLPTYLIEVYGVDLKQAGLLSSLPLVAGMAGCLLGGIATDRLTRRLGLKWGRNLMGIGSKLVAGLSFLSCLLVDDANAVILLLALTAFATDTGLGATWAYFQDAGGSYVGTLLGWANMFGNLGSFVSPLLLGYLAMYLDWPATLGMIACLFFVSAGCWLGMDARIPIVPPEWQPEAKPLV